MESWWLLEVTEVEHRDLWLELQRPKLKFEDDDKKKASSAGLMT